MEIRISQVIARGVLHHTRIMKRLFSFFMVPGLAIAWGLFRLGLFNIVPIARDTIIEGMRDGIIVLDTNNHLIDMNHVAERIIDCPVSRAIGQPVDRIPSLHPELLELLDGFTDETLESEIKTGGTQYYQVSISTLHDHRGHRRGRLLTLHDITDYKLTEARGKELEIKAHLASRLSTVGEMAAGIAHEISNPLASVIGYTDLLLKRNIPDDIREDLEVIDRGAKRAANILDRLLTFTGQRYIEWDYIDINRIIESAIELRKYSLSNNNIEVIKQFDHGPLEIMADGGQLQEVFLNLIINAETSMKEYHGRGKLTIKTEVADKNIRLYFQDDGAGISEDNINKIFDPFFTTKEPGKGTGLGLSICHTIIAEHHGRIYAESRQGRGTTFIIELPVPATDVLVKSRDFTER